MSCLSNTHLLLPNFVQQSVLIDDGYKIFDSIFHLIETFFSWFPFIGFLPILSVSRSSCFHFMISDIMYVSFVRILFKKIEITFHQLYYYYLLISGFCLSIQFNLFTVFYLKCCCSLHIILHVPLLKSVRSFYQVLHKYKNFLLNLETSKLLSKILLCSLKLYCHCRQTI